MKIIQLNAVYEYSSTGRTTTELHELLQQSGHESYVAARNIKRPTDHLIRLNNCFDLRFHSIMSHLTGKQGYFSYISTKKLLRKMDTIKPDLVHLRVLHSNCINLPMLLKYLAKHNIPTVLTLHDCWYFTGHCCYFTDSNCEKWKSGCGNCPDYRKWNSSWLFDCSKSNLEDKKKLFANIKNLAVIGVSKWVTNFVKDSILKDAKIIKHIYNWLDLEIFKPTNNNVRKKFGLINDFVVLGVAQNWGIQKGILEFKTLAEKLPEYKFLLVGNMPEQYKPLPDNIVLVGVTDSISDLVNYYSAADVFFNPSIRETFGKVTIEAEACGTPVVAFGLTATPELVPKDCGFITEYKDLNAVITALRTIETKTKLSYTQSCLNFAAKFNKKDLAREYIALYEEMINKRVM